MFHTVLWICNIFYELRMFYIVFIDFHVFSLNSDFHGFHGEFLVISIMFVDFHGWMFYEILLFHKFSTNFWDFVIAFLRYSMMYVGRPILFNDFPLILFFVHFCRFPHNCLLIISNFHASSVNLDRCACSFHKFSWLFRDLL